jgi:hypothetical protein
MEYKHDLKIILREILDNINRDENSSSHNNNVFTYLLTYSWSWAPLEKLPIVQLLKNFPTFYGTRRFITALTRALHWSLSW